MLKKKKLKFKYITDYSRNTINKKFKENINI